MPSIFPGMDPYLEDQEWEDFHATFNTVLREVLSPAMEPKYFVRVERRVYVEHGLENGDQVRWADVSVVWDGNESAAPSPTAAQSATSLAPVECLLPSPQERRETYLVVREVPSLEIVTVIETLSPANKRASSDGRAQYLAKREEILRSGTNLVALDLLRGGKRLSLVGSPVGDYFAIVSRGIRRPKAEVYAWSIRQALPEIPIPLKPGEPDVRINLQDVFNSVYERARYQLSLNYEADLRPPLNGEDAAWRAKLPVHKHG
jgi:hypothetical protein